MRYENFIYYHLLVVFLTFTRCAFFFLDLDVFVPTMASSARGGAGFGIGANLVGFPGGL